MSSTLLSDFRPEVRRVLPAIIGARFAINVAMRMGYTFLPAFARGAGLSVEAMSTTLSARELTALSAPYSGKATDRLGPVTVMARGGLLAAGGLLVATLGAPGLIAGLVLFGFGRTAHQVALNAWIGNVVAYQRRGRATGLIELSWGASALLGLPLVGLIIGGVGWWAAPGALGLATVAFSLRVHHHDSTNGRPPAVPPRKPKMTRAAVATMATTGTMTAAAQFLFLGHGLWLEDTYGLNTAEVGLAIVAVGAIEVVATAASSRFTDRLGKRQSILAGALPMAAAMAALAAVPAPPLWFGLVLLVVAFLGFEFGIVSAIPLVSELDPEARATMVGRAVSVVTIVRAVVTLAATAIYVNQGFAVLMTVATAAALVAIALAILAVTEPPTEGTEPLTA